MRTITTAALAALLLLTGAARAADVPSQLREGRGEDELVLIHGLGSNAAIWDGITPYLKGTFHVWAFELSGHGKTAPVDRPTIAGEAARLGAYLDAEDIQYPTLVGHGVGGMIALRYALDNPARVRRLVLMDTTAKSLTTEDQQLDTAAKLAADYDRTVAERYLNMSPDDQVTERILDDALRTDSATFISLLMDTNRFDVTGELGDLTVPLLIVGSELMFPAEVDSRVVLGAVGFANARTLSFKRMERTGHFMMLEKPMLTASVILAFAISAGYQFQR